jgi:small-conductance mechanosensitive channel
MRANSIIKFMAILVFLMLFPVSVFAQSMGILNVVSENAVEQATSENITDLISTLSKDELEVLSKLLKIITEKESSKIPASVTENIEYQEVINSIRQDYSNFMWDNIRAFPVAIDGGFQALRKILGGRGSSDNLLFAGLIALVIIIGVAVEFAANKVLKIPRENTQKPDDEISGITFKSYFLNIAKELLKIAAFIVASLVTAKILISNQTDQFLAVNFILYVLLGIRLMITFLRSILAPDSSSARLVTIDDKNAKFFYKYLIILTCIAYTSLFLVQIMNRFQMGGILPFRFWTGHLIHIILVYMLWQAREGITSIIRGDDQNPTKGMKIVADWWPIFSIIAISVQMFLVQLGISTGAVNIPAGSGILTMSLIIFTPFFDTLLRAVINNAVPELNHDDVLVEAANHATRNSYVRIGRILLITLIFTSIGKIWGIDYVNLAQLGFGAQIATRGGGFLLILAVGYLVWEVTNLWVNRQLANESAVGGASGAGGGDEGGGTGQSRLASILPLVRMAIQISVVVLTVLLALSQLGVNITPLLAGAGVFGLAIGFGAQALVKDVVSGVFFLWDDAFRLGEYIDIGGTVGTVQKISIRSLQLRHPNGPVHVIPYGEIPQLTNNSRDYVIMKLRFTVPFDTDLEKVRKLFKKIGQDMMEDPALADSFIQPFKSQGAADVDDVGIVVRGKFTTRPGEQWAIRKQVYSRVQKAFEENGIDFARREVRVNIPDLEHGTELKPEQKQAVAAAAGQAVSIAADQQKTVKKVDDPF